MSKRNLFTIPYAGGNRFSFKKFDNYLRDDFHIYHLELAGRGERMDEELMRDIYEIRDDLFEQIKDKLDEEYFIYGHSLGGLLGYLLILLIEEKRLNTPSKFVVSGKANPSLKPAKIKHTLSQDDFFNHLKSLGGMPSEFFKYPELFEFFEPILRADFEAMEKYSFDELKKLNTKISVLCGSQESFTIDDALKWQEFGHQNIDFKEFKGGHFFIFNNTEDVCKIITND